MFILFFSTMTPLALSSFGGITFLAIFAVEMTTLLMLFIALVVFGALSMCVGRGLQPWFPFWWVSTKFSCIGFDKEDDNKKNAASEESASRFWFYSAVHPASKKLARLVCCARGHRRAQRVA
ncbi:MAG: hypothetical protein FJ009_01805 [Chloroflexi bacterium]|nr:hypothetical protein [Chloroflexota bacterium]